MSKGYWIIAVALGLGIYANHLTAQSTAENQPRQEESTTDANQEREEQGGETEDLTAALEGIEAAIRDLIAEEDKIAAEAQQNREQRDLEAQEDMAIWAERMFYATAATVALTLVALYAIIRTLHHTRRAADYTEGMLVEAKATTVAAVTNVEIAQTTSTNQLRPWLAFRGFNNMHLQDTQNNGSQEPIGIGFQPILENFGQSPAIIESNYTNFRLVKPSEPTPSFIADLQIDRGVFGPHVNVNLPTQSIFGDEYEKVMSGELHFVLYSKVVYSGPLSAGINSETESTVRISRNGTSEDGYPNFNKRPDGPQNTLT